MKDKILKNIPNAITMLRLIMSILAPIALFKSLVPLSFAFYIIGALSDCADGFLARKLNAYSDFGKKLDGLSDKMYALSLIMSSLFLGNLLVLVPMLLEGRISVTNIISHKLGLDPTTEKVGKYKTVLLFPTLILSAYAPFIKEIYYLLAALVPTTAVLQVKCIKAYDNQLVEKFQSQVSKPECKHATEEQSDGKERSSDVKTKKKAIKPLIVSEDMAECHGKNGYRIRRKEK